MSDIYLHLNGQQIGPYQPAQVRQLLIEGKISAETPAWHKELSEWSTVDKVLANFPDGGTAVPPFVPFRAPPPPPPAKKGMNGCLLAAIIVCVVFGGIFVFSCLAGIALGPINVGLERAKENVSMQKARTITLAMFQYSVDHNGVYPDGKTSTEVFQKLIDEKYISDPSIFYISMSGKIQATSSTLTPENVCFDVTSGVTSDSSDYVPVVFLTGFTVTYTAGASAKRDLGTPVSLHGMAVAYKNNSANIRKVYPDGSVPVFVPTNFYSGAKTYRQLRP